MSIERRRGTVWPDPSTTTLGVARSGGGARTATAAGLEGDGRRRSGWPNPATAAELEDDGASGGRARGRREASLGEARGSGGGAWEWLRRRGSRATGPGAAELVEARNGRVRVGRERELER